MTLITWFGGPTPAAAQAPPPEPGNPQHSTAQDFLSVPVRPVAIGHHGMGPYTPSANFGLPIENTVDSVRQAYTLGARVVEVDVQLTADGRLAVFHDDFLSDFTCIHSVTLGQLQARLPYVPELRQIVNVAREFNNRAGASLGGILIAELKAFSPLCDPGDSFEQPLVSATVSEIRQAHFADRVMFETQRKAPGRAASVEPRPEPRAEKKPPVLREALLRTLRSSAGMPSVRPRRFESTPKRPERPWSAAIWRWKAVLVKAS
jgi:hypothetical protein